MNTWEGLALLALVIAAVVFLGKTIVKKFTKKGCGGGGGGCGCGSGRHAKNGHRHG